MFKIKKDVDLKQLKSFGYELGMLGDIYCYEQTLITYRVCVNVSTKLILVVQTVFGNNPSNDYEVYKMYDIEDYIEDLIKAGLVEEVNNG